MDLIEALLQSEILYSSRYVDPKLKVQSRESFLRVHNPSGPIFKVHPVVFDLTEEVPCVNPEFWFHILEPIKVSSGCFGTF